MTHPTREVSLTYLHQTIDLAKKSSPKPTNFRVGCVIVAFDTLESPQILSTGYTLELPGNTHAEQCALSKLAEKHSVPEDKVGILFSASKQVVLYTSLEPCGKRLSGNLPCVQRIIATRNHNPQGGIRKVIFGAKEPGTFVEDSQSCKLLRDAGIDWEYLPDFEPNVLAVAMEGHTKQPKTNEEAVDQEKQLGNAASSSGANKQEQRSVEAESTPRNPKKRMMEAPPGSEASRS